jgi:uncharacterized protein
LTLPHFSFEGLVNLMRNSVRAAVRLTPRARADRVRFAGIADRKPVVKASVTAPAENGRANGALLQPLAATCGVPRRDLAIIAGAASRLKTVRTSGDPEPMLERLGAWLATLPGR